MQAPCRRSAVTGNGRQSGGAIPLFFGLGAAAANSAAGRRMCTRASGAGDADRGRVGPAQQIANNAADLGCLGFIGPLLVNTVDLVERNGRETGPPGRVARDRLQSCAVKLLVAELDEVGVT